nr:MAG TPA: hypothetical protein [Caudoviricetes sp.]
MFLGFFSHLQICCGLTPIFSPASVCVIPRWILIAFNLIFNFHYFLPVISEYNYISS